MTAFLNNLLNFIKLSRYPISRLIVGMQSYFNFLKSLSKKTDLVFERPYDKQNILIIALYENAEIRNDILNLLKVAKDNNLFIICVNTLKINNKQRYKGLMDCYIERYNFGRDFGSYQEGILYLMKHNLLEECPRLILLNDSVFYSENNLNNFISTLSGTKIDVLGATENHEIEHHLGSFCLSISNSVLVNNKFIRFWKDYKKSDVRPRVIKYGEMRLSKTLKRCASSDQNFKALFDLDWFSETVKRKYETLDIINLIGAEAKVPWKKPSFQSISSRMYKKYLRSNFLFKDGVDISLNMSKVDSSDFIDSEKRIVDHISKLSGCDDKVEISNRVATEILNELIECFSIGSQIHQNAIILLHLGLPIIKLDGLYRGMFSVRDIELLIDQLNERDSAFFRTLMYSKPYGGEVMIGFKFSAFERGYI
jgi:hypothetical protein